MTDSARQPQHRSIVLSHDATDDQLIQKLEELGQVDVCNDVSTAAAQLETGDVSLVVCHPDDILEFGDAAVGGQAARILEALDSAAGIFDTQGKLLWGNREARRLPDEIVRRVTQTCTELFNEEPVPGPIDGRSRSRRLSTAAGGRAYEITLTPIHAPGADKPQIASIINDVTHARRLQQKVDAIDQAGRELVRLDTEQFTKLDAAQRLGLLEDRIIRFTKDLLHFDNFTILLMDRKSNKLEVALSGGRPQHAERHDIFVSTEENGISGYVAATGRSYNCPDVTKDPRYLPGLDDARSSLTVPLRLQDRVIGVFNVEATRIGAFTEDDRQFAEIFARYVALAMNIMDLLIVERYTATGRLADNVSAEIAGPLNDIISEAYAIMEEYIGHDDMRRRLQAIVDNVTVIRTAIKEVVKPTTGVLGRRGGAAKRDPVLADKRILIAEDETLIRDTIREVLSKHGAVTETARSGSEALAMIDRQNYDLVISDIKLPQKNGYEIFAAAKEKNADVPVILMTGFGYDPNHSIIRARQEGLAAVLFKPFKVDELLSEVRNALTPAE